MAQFNESKYQPVITPVDLFTKDRSLHGSSTYEINSASDKAPFGTVRISNTFLERMDTIGKIYFIVIAISIYVAILSYSESVYVHNFTYVNYLITYIVANLFGNFYLCRKYNAVFKPVEAKDLPDEMWTFCSYCQEKQPPKCHHCPLCHKCIVKRDHHCFFIGTCIGERNQGYFAVYCFYAAIGLYLGFQVLSQYLSSTYYELYSWDFYHYIPPITLFQLVRGNVDLLTFLLVFLLSGCMLTGIFTALLFLWECALIACDLTTYDAQLAWSQGGILWSKLRPWYNIKAVFGPIPLFPFIIPIPLSATRAIYGSRSSKTFL